MATFQALLRVIRALWNFGTGWVRLVIRAAILVIVFGVVIPLLVWPFVLLGVSFVGWSSGMSWITAVVTFVPLAVFLVFVIAAGTILILAYPLVSGVLLAIPQVRSVLGGFLVAVFVAVFAELVIGLYTVLVPVWNWPKLIPVLALLVVVLGMWLFLKRKLGWRQGGWVTAMLSLGIVVVTAMFLTVGIWQWASQRAVQAVSQVQIPPIQAVQAFQPEEFKINAGEEIFTALVGPGTQHRVRGDKPWIALTRDEQNGTYKRPDGNYRLESYSVGQQIVWRGGTPEGPLLVRGLEDGTTLRFERVR